MNTDLPRSFKLITLWLLLGVVVFVGVQWWLRREQQTQFQLGGTGTVEIRRGSDGHYHWPGRINGHAVDFLIDTGATGTAIPESLARKLKLSSTGTVRSNTAGGVVTGQLVRADLELRGGVNVRRLSVLALPGLGPDPLLGMDVLGTLRLQQRDSVLRIETNPPP